jgi:hypothetical protein
MGRRQENVSATGWSDAFMIRLVAIFILPKTIGFIRKRPGQGVIEPTETTEGAQNGHPRKNAIRTDCYGWLFRP